MKENKIKGSVLIVSSSRGSEPAWSPYGISKWGLKGLVEGLGKMLIPYGINVNAIAPGSTATGLIGIKEGDSITSEENGMNRLIMPDEVATLAKLLVSDAGKMIDGEVVHIAAGRGTFDIRRTSKKVEKPHTVEIQFPVRTTFSYEKSKQYIIVEI